MARLWSIRKSSEKLASFSGEAGEASFSELFGVIEQSFLELFGASPVIERTLTLLAYRMAKTILCLLDRHSSPELVMLTRRVRQLTVKLQKTKYTGI